MIAKAVVVNACPFTAIEFIEEGNEKLSEKINLLVMSFYFVVCHGMVILFCLKFLDFPEVRQAYLELLHMAHTQKSYLKNELF